MSFRLRETLLEVLHKSLSVDAEDINLTFVRKNLEK